MPRAPVTAALRLILISLALWCRSAAAAIVPDDYPTIQAAIDAGSEEIMVRPGVYPETPMIPRPLVLRGLLGTGSTDLPVIAGMMINDSIPPSPPLPSPMPPTTIAVSDLRFTGPVLYTFHGPEWRGPQSIGFERCALDSGLQVTAGTYREQLAWSIHRCMVRGALWIGLAERARIDSNDVEGSVNAQCAEGVVVRENRVRGPGPLGIYASSNGVLEVHRNFVSGFATGIAAGGGYDLQTVSVADNIVEDCASRGISAFATDRVDVAGNQIRRCGEGVVGSGSESTSLYRNLIEDCSATAAFVYSGDYNWIENNTIRRCGGGIVCRGGRYDFATFHYNHVEQCGGAGIEAIGFQDATSERDTIVDCQRGLHFEAEEFTSVMNGRVLSCRGPGITASAMYLYIVKNVVGRCKGDGLALTGGGYRTSVGGNTSYLNSGSGFRLDRQPGSIADSVDHNVSFRNQEFGFVLSDANPVRWLCNDWFENMAGVTSGHPPDATDLSVDPIFCALSADDVHLTPGSPLADPPGCGLIGALGIGCDAATASLVALFAAERVADGILVRWDVRSPWRVELERAYSESGPWASVGGNLSPLGSLVDRGDPQGRTLWYRLGLRDPAGLHPLGEPVVVQARASELSLIASPNPARGPLHIDFVVTSGAVIEIDLLDVAGRSVASLARGWHPAGPHKVEWSARGLRPGRYLLRYRFPGGQQTRGLTILS